MVSHFMFIKGRNRMKKREEVVSEFITDWK